jgi:hypothetical protein
MNESEANRQTAIVEDALRTLPLNPVPGTLRIRVMHRVRSTPRAPRFVFPWLEGAISLMLSTLLTSMAYVMIGLHPVSMLHLEQSIRLFFLLPANRPLLAAAIPVLGMLAVCLLLTVQLFQPRRKNVRIVAAR